jgi:hypothetical protein
MIVGMRGLAAIAVLLAACSASNAESSGDGGAEASDDTGIGIDATQPVLDLQPSKSLVVVDTAPSIPTSPTLAFTARLHDATGDNDVTSALSLSVTNPTLGTFDHNVFTASISPKDAVWGATDTVEGRAGSAYATATLTVAWLKMTGDRRVAFFQSPTGQAPAPARDVLAQVVPSGAPIDIGYLMVNDPRNPPEIEGGVPIDAEPLIARVRAMSEGDATNGCPPITTKDGDGDGIDDTFVAAPGDSKVCFEITPAKNDTLTRSMFLDAYIDVVQKPSDAILQLRTVLFFVPP